MPGWRGRRRLLLWVLRRRDRDWEGGLRDPRGLPLLAPVVGRKLRVSPASGEIKVLSRETNLMEGRLFLLGAMEWH